MTLTNIRQLKKGSTVLDIGFGYPFLSTFLGQEYDIYGTDIEPEALKNLDEKRYKHANIEEVIPFGNSKFDCIVMLELIEHLRNIEKVFKEIKRVLKPGGIVLIATPNYSFLPGLLWKAVESTYFRMCAKGYKHVEQHHINKYSKHRIASELNTYFGHVEVMAMSYGMGLFAICKTDPTASEAQ